MRVLITGVNGFVASHLVDYISANYPDVEIYGTKRWRSSLENISHCVKPIQLADCDLRDLSSLISVFQTKFDKVFHLAAQSFVPFSYQAPAETLETNVIGTANLLEAIRITKQDPLIHICSSSEVYGQPLYTPIDENHPLNPISPYGVSKVAEDRLGFAYYKAYGMKVVITRMFTHTGPRQHEALVTSNFAKQVALIEKAKRPPFLEVGNLQSIRTFADVRDTVRAYWLLNDNMVGEVYNIGGNRTMTIGGMIDMLQEMATRTFVIKKDPSRLRPADVTLQIPDCSKFQKKTGWETEIPFEKTLSDLLQFWRDKV